jgi:16S rRNA A1518/A1519 N6-dimethyltransferase RsmA/KsgA/DIM1 with predicted DNA glycosylase/AP lyase activity
VVLDLKPCEHDPEALERALTLASKALTLPRKMLSNALPEEIENSIIEAAGLDPTQRPGTVSLDGWMRLAERS